MPVIKQYGQRVSAPDAGIGTNISAPSEAFGSAEAQAMSSQAQAMSKIGSSVSQVGNTLMRIAEKEETLDVQAKLAKKRNELSQRFKQEYNSASLDDKEFAERFIKTAKEELEAVGKDLSTRAGRMAFEEQRNAMVNQFMGTAQEAQSQLAGMKAMSDFEVTQNELSSSLISTPASLPDVMKQYENSVNTLVETGSVDRGSAQKMLNNGRELMGESSVRGWIELSPALARQKLMSGEYDKYLSGPKKASLLKQVETKLKVGEEMTMAREYALKDMFANDPYKAAVQKEVQYRFDTFDPTNPESIQRREEQRQEFQSRYGGMMKNKMPFLSEPELDLLADDFESGSVERISQRLAVLNENMTDQQKRDLSEQLFKKKPALGIAFSVSRTDKKTSQEIFLGQKALKDESFSFETPELDMKTQFTDYIGDAVGPESSEFKSSSYQAVKSLLAYKKSIGEIDKAPDKDDIEQATEQILGPVMEINDKKTFTFRDKDGKWVSENYFINLYQDVDMETVEKTMGSLPRHTSGVPMSRSEFQRSKFISAGDGKYFIQYSGDFIAKTDKNGAPIYDKQGRLQKYVIDFKAIEATGKIKKPNFFGF